MENTMLSLKISEDMVKDIVSKQIQQAIVNDIIISMQNYETEAEKQVGRDGEQIKELLEENERLTAQLAESQRRERAAVGIVETVDEAGEPYQYEHYICPGCKRILSQRLKGSKVSVFTPNYCPDCGQKIEWRGPREAGKGEAE